MNEVKKAKKESRQALIISLVALGINVFRVIQKLIELF